ncbi:MAG: hypothetical protein F4077_05605 [Gammaproteobacteria bacterium]|nr:hypothetical protein [Gammaproteobacteria bacterium]MYI77224.1 hypothetical protein [Gammaproteobacteria bacterium]
MAKSVDTIGRLFNLFLGNLCVAKLVPSKATLWEDGINVEMTLFLNSTNLKNKGKNGKTRGPDISRSDKSSISSTENSKLLAHRAM